MLPAFIFPILLLIQQITFSSYYFIIFIPFSSLSFRALNSNPKGHSPRLTSYTKLWTVLVSSWIHCLPHCMASIGIKKDLTKLIILLLTDLLFYSIHTYYSPDKTKRNKHLLGCSKKVFFWLLPWNRCIFIGQFVFKK